MHVVCSDNPVTKRKVLFFSPGVPGTWRADTSPNTPNHGPPTSSYIIQSLTLNKTKKLSEFIKQYNGIQGVQKEKVIKYVK